MHTCAGVWLAVEKGAAHLLHTHASASGLDDASSRAAARAALAAMARAAIPRPWARPSVAEACGIARSAPEHCLAR